MTDSVQPLVSIIIPVYNVETYLHQCLDSIVNQTYKNIEIICVNDGSTDNSLSVLQEYKQNDSRIIILDIPNNGVSNARNQGLEQALGEWVMFVDSDDWLERDCLQKLLLFNSEHQSDIIMFPYISEHVSGPKERKLFKVEHVFMGEELRTLARRMIGPIGKEITNPAQLDSYGSIWGKIYRKSLIKDLNFVDLKIVGTCEDSIFNMQIFKSVTKVIYTNSTHYHYRKTNNNSITSRYRSDLISCWHRQYRLINDLFSDVVEKEALQNRIALNVLGASLNESKAPKKTVALNNLLRDNIYHSCLQQLNIKYLPFYWKLFFFFAKHKMTHCLMFLLYCIRKLR